ncbi:hypothetical protein CEXT_38531 [Caerostris extrusa]|uniref:Secreted protein n=1 Tax=Caerostris extrusa TaxID=172846 RepID=A0AAV4RK36_CAEEX|nr:hypothetical protein CEXT_38531 [Caerostris extrusa]
MTASRATPLVMQRPWRPSRVCLWSKAEAIVWLFCCCPSDIYSTLQCFGTNSVTPVTRVAVPFNILFLFDIDFQFHCCGPSRSSRNMFYAEETLMQLSSIYLCP